MCSEGYFGNVWERPIFVIPIWDPGPPPRFEGFLLLASEGETDRLFLVTAFFAWDSQSGQSASHDFSCCHFAPSRQTFGQMNVCGLRSFAWLRAFVSLVFFFCQGKIAEICYLLEAVRDLLPKKLVFGLRH